MMAWKKQEWPNSSKTSPDCLKKNNGSASTAYHQRIAERPGRHFLIAWFSGDPTAQRAGPPSLHAGGLYDLDPIFMHVFVLSSDVGGDHALPGAGDMEGVLLLYFRDAYAAGGAHR